MSAHESSLRHLHESRKPHRHLTSISNRHLRRDRRLLRASYSSATHAACQQPPLGYYEYAFNSHRRELLFRAEASCRVEFRPPHFRAPHTASSILAWHYQSVGYHRRRRVSRVEPRRACISPHTNKLTAYAIKMLTASAVLTYRNELASRPRPHLPHCIAMRR